MSEVETDYNPVQQIFALSLLANAVGQMTGSEDGLQKAMQEKIAGPLEAMGWDLTWGPKVLGGQAQSGDSKAQSPLNVWYIATNRETDLTKKRCVIAIAGTSFQNQQAWDDINMLVNKTVDFDAWVSGWKTGSFTPSDTKRDEARPFCARGSCNGVSNLLSQVSPSGAIAPGKRIYEVLPPPADLNNGCRVVVTGHSMGGALSPTLALGLVQSNIVDGLLAEHVQVYASAGASPGNQAFADLFSSTFPPGPEGSGYQRVNVNFYNTLDVVPQAWALPSDLDRNLENIRGKIFAKVNWFSWAGIALAGLVVKAKWLSIRSLMAYRGIIGEAFTSDNPPQGSPPVTEADLKAELVAQHVTAYLNIWGIEPLILDFEGDMLSEPGIELGDPEVLSIDTSGCPDELPEREPSEEELQGF